MLLYLVIGAVVIFVMWLWLSTLPVLFVCPIVSTKDKLCAFFVWAVPIGVGISFLVEGGENIDTFTFWGDLLTYVAIAYAILRLVNALSTSYYEYKERKNKKRS